VHTRPHVERLARLLHNRIVRRIRHEHPEAQCLLVVGDLWGGAVQLNPSAVWDAAGTVLVDLTGSEQRRLVDDLRPDFALLALFEPYLLDLHQLDLRLDG
jgi:predicted amidohydrolase